MYTETEKEEIYRTYHPKVYGYIVSRISDANTAEDIAADVFLKVYEKLGSFDETKASVSTWIYTITRNTLIDHYRTRRVLEEIPETLSGGEEVEDDICTAETLDELAKALLKLDERERTIIVLRYYRGTSLKDIAERLGISYAYVKVLQKSALGKLKKEIDV